MSERPHVVILGGGFGFVLFTLAMGLSKLAWNQEIIFAGSMANGSMPFKFSMSAGVIVISVSVDTGAKRTRSMRSPPLVNVWNESRRKVPVILPPRPIV